MFVISCACVFFCGVGREEGGWAGSCLEIVIAVGCFWLKLIVFAVVCVVSRTGFSILGCDSGTSVSN